MIRINQKLPALKQFTQLQNQLQNFKFYHQQVNVNNVQNDLVQNQFQQELDTNQTIKNEVNHLLNIIYDGQLGDLQSTEFSQIQQNKISEEIDFQRQSHNNQAKNSEQNEQKQQEQKKEMSQKQEKQEEEEGEDDKKDKKKKDKDDDDEDNDDDDHNGGIVMPVIELIKGFIPRVCPKPEA
ncbi:hypothetical protein PPERSA_04066 [Pseudocohnilembus persalinus]|uniref:Uncharacterized protein n=1 Tax=Pseudocohnilembus persalinus TaxID=266149 RepID=A0A0V0QKQ1_PSEPJ|nr:hypothetical protein PPERSA_04066 [Pseudocohnilembus persalinus]|eukprot:KRX02863.1 hypothetical protein PPERSA_04066 [Pseudocohnilembus persalinus]